MQRFIADNWPLRLWFGVVPFVAPVMVWCFVQPLPWLVSHWLNPLVFAGLLLLAWAVGWFSAIIPAWLLLGPLYYSQGLSNGAPYLVGEWVRVLAHRRRGQVAQVYEVWAARNEVRLKIGDSAREEFEDVFSYFEVCRLPAAPDWRQQTGTVDSLP